MAGLLAAACNAHSQPGHLSTSPCLAPCSGKEAGVVAGCRVTEGSIKGSLRYRVLRGGEPVHTG